MANNTKVVIQPGGKEISAVPGTNLLELIKRHKIDLPSDCGGKGKCGKCRIIIENGCKEVNSLSDTEGKHLTAQELKKGYRLACAVAVPKISRLAIRIPYLDKSHKMKLQTDGLPVSVVPDPAIKKYLVELSAPTLKDNISSDEDRLLNFLKKRYNLKCHLDYQELKKLPQILENGKGIFHCIIWNGNTIISLESTNTNPKCLGFAVDIGTTKLAGFLVDLESGEQIASSSIANPQAAYGDDLMSRMTFCARRKDGLEVLQKLIIEGINQLIEDCCTKADQDSQNIYEACLAGNPCMSHLFLGLSPKNLSMAPYHPVLRREINFEAEELPVPLKMHPRARIYILPSIAGFVGADSVAVQLSLAHPRSKKTFMVLDIGTNTEVVLIDPKGTLTCSCASGPAFEGMHLKNGMKANTGAIETVEIDPKTLEIAYQTIGGIKPMGICGSGVVDALAGFMKAKIIAPNGRIDEKKAVVTPRVRKGVSGKQEVVIAWREETEIDQDIVITQEDIEEIQKAKAAIRTGCTFLMKEKKIIEKNIDELIIAGAFGQYMDKRSARSIGLIPEIPLSRIKNVGNAAGTGVKMALLSMIKRKMAEDIAKKAQYYELATAPNFLSEYGNSMFFPYLYR